MVWYHFYLKLGLKRNMNFLILNPHLKEIGCKYLCSTEANMNTNTPIEMENYKSEFNVTQMHVQGNWMENQI